MHLDFTAHWPTIMALAGFALSLTRWLMERHLMPAPIQHVIKDLGETRVIALITEAAALTHLPPRDRMEYVIERLRDVCAREHLDVPEGFIRLAAEWVYQKVAKGRG